MSELSEAAINRVLELSAKLGQPIATGEGGVPVILVPSGMKAESLAPYLPPPRIKRTVTLLEASSFVDYVNRFKTSNTLIFANVTETDASFFALLDYHAPAPELTPAYCEHAAKFALIRTPEWKVWTEQDRDPMSQVDFATWLEDNLTLFTEPTGAALLELIQTLSGKQDVRFNSAVRLQSGANKLHFDEDVVLRGASSTTEGDVELPSVLVAGIAPFQGAPKYEVRARLKYRIESRRLSLWFETIGIHVIIRDSILLVTKEVSEKTGIIPLLGNP